MIRPQVAVCTGLALLFSLCLANAEEQKAPFDQSKAVDGGLGMPTPYDKFLALDSALAKGKIDWAKAYRDAVPQKFDADDYKDAQVAVPMALGVRIADGVLAVKAKQAEILNSCASDIEKLAKKMGVADADLTRAHAVKTAANKNEWLQVFLDLGFLQQDIMQKIEDRKDPTRGTLLIISGWMEGARYVSGLVLQNYTPEISNILREPMLVKALQDKLETLPADVKAKPAVVALRKALPGVFSIVNIPKDGSISKADVTELQRLATEAVNAATKPSK